MNETERENRIIGIISKAYYNLHVDLSELIENGKIKSYFKECRQLENYLTYTMLTVFTARASCIWVHSETLSSGV